MDISKIGGDLIGLLAQYPDVKLINAAKLMKPEERPKYPVRLVDPDPKKYAIFRARPNIEGTVDVLGKDSGTGMPTIMINRGGHGYSSGDLQKLAGTMVHENEHLARGDFEEPPAYRKQYDFLKRIGIKEKPYIEEVFRRSRK